MFGIILPVIQTVSYSWGENPYHNTERIPPSGIEVGWRSVTERDREKEGKRERQRERAGEVQGGK